MRARFFIGGLIAFVVAASGAGGCADATAIDVVVYSELSCDAGPSALIFTSHDLAGLPSATASSSATRCTAVGDGTYARGDVVIVPAGGNTAHLTFAVATQNGGGDARGCLSGAKGCIVAKRDLGFLAHATSTVRIDLRASCLDVHCASDQTCVRGQCVGASTSSCGSRCDETALLPAGAPDAGVDAPAPDAADASTSVPAALAAGTFHTCSLRPNGAVTCWGDGDNGQLGNGSLADVSVPTLVTGLADARAISAGGLFNCAVRATGKVVCWGHNDHGQLGDLSTTDRSTPVEVVGVNNAVAIGTGDAFACAGLANGEVWCWGDNFLGELGRDPAGGDLTTPAPTKTPIGATALALSGSASCAVVPKGVSCWGDDDHGELGDGLINPRSSSALVAGMVGTTSLAAGTETMYAVHGGAVSSWGIWTAGALGNGATSDALTPGLVNGISSATRDAAAGHSACALLANGDVTCWGEGNGSQVPVRVDLPAPASAITVGNLHACAAVGADADVFCWGANDRGQLGDGTATSRSTPAKVSSMP